MKQKNLILIAVAVGCGLVAAFLTSQMSAGPKKDEGVEIPVAAKELSVGTKLNKDELEKYIEYKRYPKDALPEKYAATPEDLADRRLTRAVRKGEAFNPADLTNSVIITPPPGFGVITFPTSAPEAVAGFALPGSRVDIIASVKTRGKKSQAEIVFPLFIDMLVLAIDTNPGGPQNTGAFASLSMVSVAVTPNQALLLQGALSRGAQLRMMLRNTEKSPTFPYVPTEKEIWAIFADQPTSGGSGEPGEEETPDTKNKGKMHVATENLPAGTQLTPEVIDSKFKLVDFTPPAPSNAIVNLREHANRYLQKDLAANQFVPMNYLADKEFELPKPKVEPKVEPKAAPNADVGPTAKSEPTLPKPEGKKPVYYDATIQTAHGVTRYRYQKLDNGEYKFLGILKSDGTVAPAPGSAQPETKPAEESKPTVPEAPKAGSGPISA
jgi:pilus assembly protein CpaB